MQNEKNVGISGNGESRVGNSVLNCLGLLNELNNIDEGNRQAAARNLVNGFIDLGEKLSIEPVGVNREKMHQRLLDESEILFGSSPCVLDYLNANDIVDIAVDNMNCATLHGTLISSIVCSINYNLALNDFKNPFPEKLNNSTPDKALGTLELMQAVAAQSAATSKWAGGTLSRILDTLGDYQPESVLLDCFKDSVIQKILSEEENPSLGVAKYENDPNYSRMSIILDDKEKAFEQEIYSRLPANSLPGYHHIVKLGNDAIAVTDQALVPTHFANLDVANALMDVPRSQVPELMRNRIIEGCDGMFKLTSDDTTREAVNFINYLHDKLMPFQTGKDWREVLSVDSIESLNKYADFQDKVNQFYCDRNQLFDTLSGETGLNNLKNVLSNFRENYLKGVKDGNFKFELFPEREQDIQSQIRQLEIEITERIDGEMANRAEGIMSELGDSRIDGKRIANEIKEWLDKIPKSETINGLHFKKLVDDKKYSYLKYLHHPQIRKPLMEKTCIDVRELSMATQVEFASFVINADRQTVDRVAVASRRFIENNMSPNAFCEAFLSLEFGEDFGDTVLSIAEHAEPTKSVEIFKIINKYREVSKKFGDLYRDFDPELASASEKAMNERLTDLLTTVEHVAKNGPNTFDVSPAKNNEGYVHDGKFDIRIETLVEVIDVMQSFLNSQIMLQEILADKKTKIIKTTVDNPDSLRLTSQTYRLINEEKGFAQLHVREYGSESYDRTREYGNSSGTEATISWLINPLNSHKLPEPKDQDCISVRFDREGRLVNEKSNSQNRSPIRNDGSISLDIGSVIGDASKMSTKLGRMIAAGNELRAKERGEDTFLNHNTNYFDQKYGMADNFAELVRHIKNGVERDYEKVAKNKLAQLAIKINSKREDVSRRGLAG